jgi:hypothetical protein
MSWLDGSTIDHVTSLRCGRDDADERSCRDE